MNEMPTHAQLKPQNAPRGSQSSMERVKEAEAAGAEINCCSTQHTAHHTDRSLRQSRSKTEKVGRRTQWGFL